MLEQEICRALDEIQLSDADRERLWLRIDQAAQAPPLKEVKHLQTKRYRIIIRVALIAALLAGLFAVGAYASGFLGARAIVIPEATPAPTAASDEPAVPAAPEAEEEELRRATDISLTQPQALPDDIDPAIRKKVENAAAAWQEWTEWQAEQAVERPEAFVWPEGAGHLNIADEPNEDGTYHIVFARPDREHPEDPAKDIVLKEADVTEAELRQWDAWLRYESGADYHGDLDFNYHVHDGAEEQKLIEIAGRYGLQLRRGTILLWSKETVEAMDREFNEANGTDFHTDTSGSRFLSNRALVDRLEQVGCCSGSLFYETPWGFDKVYYFDEGTFCVSWYVNLPSGERISCYGYNSMYATLSSGREVITQIADPAAFTARTHQAPDGTDVTILQNGKDVFLYVYLPNSFFEVHVMGTENMTEADVDAIADSIRYSVIGT